MSVQIIREVSADVVKRGTTRAVYAKQNDLNSRFLNIRIKEDGKDIAVDKGLTVMLNVSRPDGSANMFYGTVNEDGTVQVPMTSWMLEQVGTVVCDVSIVAEGSSVAKLTTMQFNIYVEAATVADEEFIATQEYSVIVDLLNRTTESKTIAEEAARSAEEAAGILEEFLNTIDYKDGNLYFIDLDARQAAANAQSTADAAMPRTGGPFLGTVTLMGDPTQPLQPATKQYVDNKDKDLMPKANGTATQPTLKWELSDGGTVELKRTGTESQYYLNLMHTASDGKKSYYDIMSSSTDGHKFELATRQQGVNADNALPKTGGKLTGDLTMESSYRPTILFNNSESKETSKIYSDFDYNRISFSHSPKDQDSYKEIYYLPNPKEGLTKSSWYAILTSRDPVNIAQGGTGATNANDALNNLGGMSKSGGTFTGDITLKGDPTSNLHPATKQYVDAVKTTADNAMPKSAYSLSGTTLTINW